MSLYLLLKETNGAGRAEGLLPERTPSGIAAPLKNGPEGRRFRFELLPDTEDELQCSAQWGGGRAYELLWREGYLRQEIAVRFHLKALPPNVQGHSGDLLFALAVITAAILQLRGGYPPIAATGALDDKSQVLAVEAVPAKLQAALRQMPAGGLCFYPQANDAEVDAALRGQAQAQGVKLHPVRRLEEAAQALGIAVREIYLDTPYRGLEAFEPEHRAIYFGRQADIEALRERLLLRELQGKPGLLLVAPSGAGKSSLARAGLIPALQQGSLALPGEPLLWCAWRPSNVGQKLSEAALAKSLRATLGKCLKLDGLAETDTLAGLAHSLAEKLPHLCRFLFLLDPLEELFTLDFPAETAAAFGEFLLRLQAQGTWTLALLRSDFYEPYSRQPALLKAFGGEGTYNLLPLDATALDQIIEGPARLADIAFENEPSTGLSLARRLCADMAGQTDALPLLEFALTSLYENRSPQNEMTYASYHAFGGLHGAIGTRAETLFARLDAEAQAALPDVLWALTATAQSGASRRFAARPAALSSFPAKTPARCLVDAFIQARLLVSGGNGNGTTWVHVAHESLLTWERADQEIQRFWRDLALHERLQGLAEIWREKQCDTSRLLPPGVQMQEADDLLARRGDKIEPDVREYIEASSRNERARRDDEAAKQTAELKSQRRQIQIARTVAFVLGVLATGAAAVWHQVDQERVNSDKQWHEAMKQQQESDNQRRKAEKLADLILSALEDKLQSEHLYLLDSVAKEAEEYFKDRAKFGGISDGPHQQALALPNRGSLPRNQGDPFNTLAKYRESMAIIQGLAAKDPGNSDRQNRMSAIHRIIGDILLKQGDLSGALDEYRRGKKTAQNLAKTNPDNIEWQWSLSVIHERIGEALYMKSQFMQNQPTQAGWLDALEEYRKAIKIRLALVKQDSGNIDWQCGLSVSHNKIGEVMSALHDWRGALAEYHESMKIRQALAEKYPDNPVWRRDLSGSHNRVGGVLATQGDLRGAQAEYRKANDILGKLLDNLPNRSPQDNDLLVEIKAGLSFSVLFDKQYEEALSIAQSTQSLAAVISAKKIHHGLIRANINQAHALLFLNRFEEAKEIYLKQPDEQMQEDGKTFRETALEDFKKFRKHGLNHPDMAKIEKLLILGIAQASPY